MKRIAIIIAVTVLIVGAGAAFIFRKNSVQEETVNGVAAGAGTEGTASTRIGPEAIQTPVPGDTLQIGTPNGVVTVKNFYKTAVAAEEEFLILKETTEYQITYDTYTSSFFVDLTRAPSPSVRKEAEAELLKLLGVEEKEACRLAVLEGILGSAGERKNTELSFCSGGIQSNQSDL